MDRSAIFKRKLVRLLVLIVFLLMIELLKDMELYIRDENNSIAYSYG